MSIFSKSFHSVFSFAHSLTSRRLGTNLATLSSEAPYASTSWYFAQLNHIDKSPPIVSELLASFPSIHVSITVSIFTGQPITQAFLASRVIPTLLCPNQLMCQQVSTSLSNCNWLLSEVNPRLASNCTIVVRRIKFTFFVWLFVWFVNWYVLWINVRFAVLVIVYKSSQLTFPSNK